MYFEQYILNFGHKKELYSNSIRFLSFSHLDEFLLFDLVAVRHVTDKEDNFNIVDLLYDNIENFNWQMIKNKENTHKLLN